MMERDTFYHTYACVSFERWVRQMVLLYASLTTIPSRVNRTLERTLQSLVRQTQPFDRIMITVPTVNMRGQPCDSVNLDFLQKYPTVVCVRPAHDYGPIMKYIGGLEAIPTTDHDTWVFVCDDDQSYAPDLVARLWAQRQPHSVHASLMPEYRYMPVLQTLLGYRGVLLPRAALRAIAEELHREGTLQSCCALNDDVTASVYLRRRGYQLKDSHETNTTSFLLEEHEERQDALHTLYAGNAPKLRDMFRCHWQLNRGPVLTVGILIVTGLLLVFALWLVVLWVLIKA